MYYVQRSVIVLVLFGIAVAAWRSGTLARADAAFRERTPAAIARAIELTPDNTQYLTTLALQAEYSGQDPAPLLEESAALSPRSSAPRIRLGLIAEMHGDTAAAERWLLEAFSVDRQFETRWALANFYFRQSRTEEFWKWMRSALEMSYGDRRAAFDLCWQMTADANEILTRAIPEKREVIAAYLSYLLNHHRESAVAEVADRLAKLRTADDMPLLYAASDALLEDGQTHAAADLWQALANPPPIGVTHPNFEEPRIGHGFDWRIAETPGVTYLPLDALAGHRIRFNGQQPESSELLRQVVGGLRAGTTYSLRWDARTQGMASPTGLEWRIAASAGEITASEDWAAGKMAFTPATDPAVLVLSYRRPQGQVRTDGWVDLRGVVISSPE